MNGFYLVGKITSEPEKGETINGTKLCRLRISVDKAVKDQGENFEIFDFRVPLSLDFCRRCFFLCFCVTDIFPINQEKKT